MAKQLIILTAWTLAFLLVVLDNSPLGFGPAGVVQAVAPQDKMKNFTKKYVSPFFTDDQLYNMSKTIAIAMYQGLPKQTIYALMFNNAMNTLTSTQTGQVLQYGVCLLFSGVGSTANIMSLADVVATAMGKWMNAVYNQTLTKVNSMKAVPRGVNAIYQQVYRIGAQFESQSNVCILMTSAKNSISAGYWAGFRKCLGNVIRYSNCGY